MVGSTFARADGLWESAEYGAGRAASLPGKTPGGEMVAAGNFGVSGAFKTHTCGMGFRVFAGPGQHESSNDGEVYARRASGASEPGPPRALFGWKRHAPRPVGEFLRDLRCVGGGLRSPGPVLMLAITIERHHGKRVRVAR